MYNKINLSKQIAYFRSLEKKRLECQLRLDKAKFDYVVSKVIGEKKLFVRNYSFLFDKPKNQVMARENLIKTNRVKSIESKDNSNINEANCNCYQSSMEMVVNSSNSNRKIFKRKLFADIYKKQLLPDKSGLKMANVNAIKYHSKKRNKTQRDQSTSCEQMLSKLPPLIKTNSNDKVSISSHDSIKAKNYILSAGISSIKAP